VYQRKITTATTAVSAPSNEDTVPPKLIDPIEEFTGEELAALTQVWGDTKPPGKFLKGRHGITHYIVDRDSRGKNGEGSTKSKKGMVVLSHGLGSSLKMFQELSNILVERGFSVLRYDYFGHGYGKYLGKDAWIKYTPDYFVDQLEDLLDHVYEEEQEKVIGFIGHSNGGVNGISANYRWVNAKYGAKERDLIPKMILVNPAIYAKKPVLGRIADSIPTIMTGLMKTIPPAKGLVGDTYMDASLIAFGKDRETAEYLFPDAQKENMSTNLRLFGRVKGVREHPFLEPAILGVSSYNIPGSMLPMHRDNLSKLLALSRGKSDILFLWCDLDVTVPYKENVDYIRKMQEENDNLTLEVVQGLGHECFLEDSSVIAEAVLPFLEPDC